MTIFSAFLVTLYKFQRKTGKEKFDRKKGNAQEKISPQSRVTAFRQKDASPKILRSICLRFSQATSARATVAAGTLRSRGRATWRGQGEQEIVTCEKVAMERALPWNAQILKWHGF